MIRCVIRAADHLIEMGPGAGAAGGQIVAQGTPEQVAAGRYARPPAWLRGERRVGDCSPGAPRAAQLADHRGARANNLRGETVRLPLGVLVGVCGVSGSGKSTLLIDTLGRALAPKKQTTSVAWEPMEPGEHDAIEGAPARAILVDQARAGVVSPAGFLDLSRPLRALYAASDDAQALGLEREAAGRAVLGLRWAAGSITDRDGLPARCARGLRDLPRHRLPAGGLGRATARRGPARGLRADDRRGLRALRR